MYINRNIGLMRFNVGSVRALFIPTPYTVPTCQVPSACVCRTSKCYKINYLIKNLSKEKLSLNNEWPK
jgi:hypothetical protein